MQNYGHWSSTDLTVVELWRKEGQRFSLSLSLSIPPLEKSSKSNNSIDGREGKSERTRRRESRPRYSKAIESMLSNTIHG